MDSKKDTALLIRNKETGLLVAVAIQDPITRSMVFYETQEMGLDQVQELLETSETAKN